MPLPLWLAKQSSLQWQLQHQGRTIVLLESVFAWQTDAAAIVAGTTVITAMAAATPRQHQGRTPRPVGISLCLASVAFWAQTGCCADQCRAPVTATATPGQNSVSAFVWQNGLPSQLGKG